MRYMHYMTGSVDTRKGWIDSIDDVELEASGASSRDELFDSYVDAGAFIELISKREAARRVYKINVGPQQWVVCHDEHRSAPMDYWQAIDRVRETRDELTGAQHG